MKWWIPVAIFFVVAAIILVIVINVIGKQHCAAPNNLKCGGTCINAFTDPMNCFQCGHNCGVDETSGLTRTCVNGQCTTPTPP